MTVSYDLTVLYLQFAGDAVIVIWECEEASLGEKMLTAVQCAMELEKNHGAFKVLSFSHTSLSLFLSLFFFLTPLSLSLFLSFFLFLTLPLSLFLPLSLSLCLFLSLALSPRLARRC